MSLKLNIANPSTGAQVSITLEDEKKKRIFYDKRIAQEVAGDALGDEWKGYIFKIMGGNDKQGFPMMQGVLLPKRTRLLVDNSSKCFRARRTGDRRRKSIRGCIVSHDISALALVVVKKGVEEFPKLAQVVPRRLGPKRASKIRKLFDLSKQDDPRQFVIRRQIAAKEGKKAQWKAPKIQRIVTPQVLQRKRARLALKKKHASASKAAKAEYVKLLAQRNKEKRQALISKKRSESTRTSTADAKKAAAPAAAKTKAATKAVTKAAAKATTKAAAKTKAAPTKGKAAAAPKKAAEGKPAAAKATKPSAAKKAPAAAKPKAGKK